MDGITQEAQSSFREVLRIKKELTTLKNFIKEQLSSIDKYKDALEEIKRLRKEKKEVENYIKNQYADKLAEIEECRKELQDEKEVLAHLVLKAERESVQLSFIDDDNNVYKTFITATVKRNAV